MFSPMHTPNSHAIVPTITEPCRCYAITYSLMDWEAYSSAWSWAHRRGVVAEVHMARLKFWIPEAVETEFLLRYGDYSYRVPKDDYI